MAEGRELSFITLTSRGGAGRTREKSIAALPRAWRRLRDYARYWQDEIEYIMIPEQHKSGVVRCHLIATNILTKRWWKDYGHKAGFGFMADVKPMQDAAYAPAYVAKYLGKDIHRVRWPKGFRRVRRSEGWPMVADAITPENFVYEVYQSPGAVTWEIYFLKDLGFDVRVSESAGIDWIG